MLGMVEYNGQLSGQAYVVLTVICLLLVMGFSWCFYRAIKAAGQEADEQLPDEV